MHFLNIYVTNMDPISVIELTGTVLGLSLKVYNLFKAIRDASKVIREYLSALETARRVFVDIQKYVKIYQASEFFQVDGLRLGVIEPAKRLRTRAPPCSFHTLKVCDQKVAHRFLPSSDSRGNGR